MLVVQKYGGSSVADVARVRRVAERVAKTRALGHRVVVVVSAMGNTTNELLGLARQVSAAPGRRELDMLISVGERVSMALLAMALGELGVPARSFTGSQSGIITDEAHASARVVEVRPDRIVAALSAGEVAIVAGFQGMSRTREVTTLGRGGSDTTAVVLAAALKADECEICSDVDGIYSADPRTVPGAIRLDALDLGEALALARNGAKVLFEDAVAWAEKNQIAIRASATFSDRPGTLIVPQPSERSPRIIALTRDEELAWLPLARIHEVTAPCIRSASPHGILVDRRNLHAPINNLTPAATVSVVGARVGQNPHILSHVLDVASRSGEIPPLWQATVDAVTFQIEPSKASALEAHFHKHLLTPASA